MTETTDLKQAARAMWAAGDYDAIATHIWSVGERLVRRLEVAPGERVLDVACGTGNAAVPAACAGARVTGLDLTPELLSAARARAGAAGVEVEWVEGDAEALPFPDGSFDVVVSTFGAMFAPDQAKTADELLRVLRPGGRLGLCSWTPQGNIGAFFRCVTEHDPPPGDGAPPLLWGAEEHVRALLGDRVVELTAEREVVDLVFDSAEDAAAAYGTQFGPVVQARERLEPEGRWPELRGALTTLFETGNVARDGGLRFPAEYLVVVGRRAG